MNCRDPDEGCALTLLNLYSKHGRAKRCSSGVDGRTRSAPLLLLQEYVTLRRVTLPTFRFHSETGRLQNICEASGMPQQVSFAQTKPAPEGADFVFVQTTYGFLRFATPNSPRRPEPNSQTAAGTGTTAPSFATLPPPMIPPSIRPPASPPARLPPV